MTTIDDKLNYLVDNINQKSDKDIDVFFDLDFDIEKITFTNDSNLQKSITTNAGRKCIKYRANNHQGIAQATIPLNAEYDIIYVEYYAGVSGYGSVRVDVYRATSGTGNVEMVALVHGLNSADIKITMNGGSQSSEYSELYLYRVIGIKNCDINSYKD